MDAVKYLDFPVDPYEADEAAADSHPVLWDPEKQRAIIGPLNAYHRQLEDAADRAEPHTSPQYRGQGRINRIPGNDPHAFEYEHYDWDNKKDEPYAFAAVKQFMQKRFPHYNLTSYEEEKRKRKQQAMDNIDAGDPWDFDKTSMFVQPDIEASWRFGDTRTATWQIRPSRAGQLNPNSPVQPWIANPQTNELLIGRRGTYHQDLMEEHAPGMRREDLVTGVISRNGVETYNDTHPRANAAGNALAYHMGIPHVKKGPDESLWAFGKTAGADELIDLLKNPDKQFPKVDPAPSRPEPVKKTPAQWIQDEKENYWDRSNEAHEEPHRVQWVPTSEIAKFREYDRRPGGADSHGNEARWHALRDHIAQHGIGNPLVLDFNQDKSTAHLSEGNHRIQLAEELGHPAVPVRVYRSRRSSPGEQPVTLHPEKEWEDRFDPSGYHIPEMMLPSHIGLPTVDPPARLSSMKLKFTEVKEANLRVANNGDYELAEGSRFQMARRPFIYNDKTREVIVGPHGAFHSQISEDPYAPNTRHGALLYGNWSANSDNDSKEVSEVRIFGHMPPGVIAKIQERYLGKEDKTSNPLFELWDFGSLDKESAFDPWADSEPHSEEVSWDFENDPEFQKLLPGAVDPATAKPWKLGQHGKGYLTDNNELHTWATNGSYGAPHHGEVAQHMGHNPTSFFVIEPSGHVDTSGGMDVDPAQQPILHNLLRQNKMIPGAPPRREDDEWHFGHVERTSFGAWTPGNYGKWIVEGDGTVHQWPVKGGWDGLPTHAMYEQDHPNFAGNPLWEQQSDEDKPPFTHGWIHPDGQLTPSHKENPHHRAILEQEIPGTWSDNIDWEKQPHEDWHFASAPIKVIPSTRTESHPNYDVTPDDLNEMHGTSIPFNWDPDRSEIHLGHPGLTHGDLDDGLNARLYGGQIEFFTHMPGNIQLVKQNAPHILEAMRPHGATGIQLGQWHVGDKPSEGFDDWHFGKTAAGILRTPWPYNSPTPLAPQWQPGHWGKGYVATDGKAYAWSTGTEKGDDSGLLHHEVMKAHDPHAKDFRGCTYIDPEGNVDMGSIAEQRERLQPLVDAHPALKPAENTDWYFGHTASNEYWDVAESDFDPAQSVVAPAGYTHKPFIADPSSNTIFIGPVGSHHIDLARHHQVGGGRKNPYSFESGAIDEGYIHPYTGCSDAVTDAVCKHTGLALIPDQKDWDFFSPTSKVARDDWHFASLPTPEWQNGGHEHDTLEPYGDPIGTTKPWQPGLPGKGFLEPSGKVHTWATSHEHPVDGFPHHGQVMRPLGFEWHEGRQPFQIDEKGRAYTLLPRLYPETLNAISGIPGLRMKTQQETEDEWGGWDFDSEKTAGLEKTADKLNDFLNNPKSRPDLQTPEAQQFLGVLGNGYANPTTDPMLPWLTREWKKKRVTYAPNGRLQYQVPGHPEPTQLSPARLETWGDWYKSNHPTRQGVDLMQKKIHEVHDFVGQHDNDVAAAQRAGRPTSGPVHHELPNGWNIQRLYSPQALTEEGERMGHCVGDYHEQVKAGDTKIYSLRDEKNVPHVTMEVRPHGVSGALERPHDVVFNARINSPEGQALIDQYGDEAVERRRAQDDQVRAEDPEWDRPEGYYDEYKGMALDELPRKLDAIRRIGFGPNNGHIDLYRKLFPGPKPLSQAEHAGVVEQIQGQGNKVPKPEYQAMIKHWMNTIPPEDRPEWKQVDPDENYADDYDQLTDEGDVGGYSPHGDYGIKGDGDQGKDFYWDRILESIGDRYPMHEVADTFKKHLGPADFVSPQAKIELRDAINDKIRDYQNDHENEFDDMYSAGEYGHYKDDLEHEDFLLPNGEYSPNLEEEHREQHLRDARQHHDEHGDSWSRERANELEELKELLKHHVSYP